MMNNLNSSLIEGNLTGDPEIRKTHKGTNVCNFNIATDRFYKQDSETQKEVSFFGVETWSRLAERCHTYLKKGRGVRVVGRLKQDRWLDDGGNPRSRIKVVAEHVEFRPQSRNGNHAAKEDGTETQKEKTAETDAVHAEEEEAVKEVMAVAEN